MTKEEILAMKPGRELDAWVGKAFKVPPRIKWSAMDKDESGYYIKFDNQREANEWHTDITTKYPNHPYSADGGHLVREEVFQKYSTDISAAWGVVERMPGPYALQKSYEEEFEKGETGWMVTWCKEEECDLDECCEHGNSVWALTAPEAICKAALFAVMEDRRNENVVSNEEK